MIGARRDPIVLEYRTKGGRLAFFTGGKGLQKSCIKTYLMAVLLTYSINIIIKTFASKWNKSYRIVGGVVLYLVAKFREIYLT